MPERISGTHKCPERIGTMQGAENTEKQQLSAPLRARMWEYRIISVIVCAFSFWIASKGNWNKIPVSIATVVLIIGIAIWMLGSPDDYNGSTDICSMIAMDCPRKIEEFYEAYKDVRTPLGSGYLVQFYTMRQPALMFGPDKNGDFLYFWLSKDGNIGYLGYSFMTSMIKGKYNDPIFPAEEDFGDNTAKYVCYQSDVLLMQKQLRESLEHFVKTKQVLEIPQSRPSEVYTFTEDFKLTGQHFDLCDSEGKHVFEIEGTAPLRTLSVYDNQHNEIFKMTKKVVSVLPTYQFYYRGELYGTLEKKFVLVKDKFEMKVKEGKLELTEYAGSIGHNFCVTLNGKTLGTILDNLDLKMENIVFDNAVIIAYEEKYLPLLTAMAVMAARELARDRS